MAWDKTKPENDMLLVNFPSACRANWDALELGTAATLLITNAKVSASAGIVDTKLAQITTAAKVSGTALTLLPNVPSGAGVLPDANSNGKLKADSLDTTPQYLDSLIDAGMFQISAGDLLQLADSLTYAGNWVNLGSVDTVDINGGTIDGVVIGLGGKLTGGAHEIEGSAFDINGGTMDGVQIGGTTATGELIVNNSSDDADGLGSQGASGQYLKSNGAGSNPSWATVSSTPPASSVGQSQLKTTTGAVSTTAKMSVNYHGVLLTLPGGTYGFYPQVKVGGGEGVATLGYHSDNSNYTHGFTNTTYATRIIIGNAQSSTGNTIYAQQRYITASGHDHWIFLLIDKITKKIISFYQAPDHPSANQGEVTEIDIPHPFGSYDPEKHEIVVVDNSELQQMVNKKRERVLRGEKGVCLLQVINENFIIDDTKRPKYNPREIVKIDEEGFVEGEVIQRMKTPDWAKVMITSPEIYLKRRMVERLPNNILFKKMVLKK